MKLFLGEYEPNITEGNRLALPKKIRECLGGENLILTRGFENCIAGYRQDTWQEQSEARSTQSTDSQKNRQLHRYLFSGAAELMVDRQGRVVIPSNLLDYARVSQSDNQTMVVGVGDHFEIWNKADWQSYLTKISQEVGKDEQ